MKKRIKTVAVILCLVLLLGTAVSASSRTVTMDVVYSDINLVVDGIPITPKDANGKTVEPFIYEGTTYLPVRAVGEALGKTVDWDGDTKTVYVGNVPGEDIYLLDVCPPYERSSYEAPETLSIMGVKYQKGFSMQHLNTCFAYFNLNGQYDMLNFDVGHIDGSGSASTSCKIYLDGKLVDTLEFTPDMLLTHYSIPLHGALQLKIEMYDTKLATSTRYGFVNAILS